MKSRSIEGAFDAIHQHLLAMVDAGGDDVLLYCLRDEYEDATLYEALERIKDALADVRFERRRAARRR